MADDQFIQIKIDDAWLKELFRKVHSRLDDMSPVMRRIAEYLVTSVQENFQVGGRYSAEGSWMGGSRKWAPLSPVTIKRREKKGHWPGMILISSARLAASINQFYTKDAAGAGTNVVYAANHQFGAKKGAFGQRTFIQRVREHIRRLKTGRESTVREHERTVTMSLPWGNIPARPFLVAQPEDIIDIQDLLMSYITAP